MDEQEEKQITTPSSSISTTTSSQGNKKSETDPIPINITVEILSRLPAKSILRYRSVCKIWSFIINTTEFIKARSNKTTPPCVLLIFRKHDKLVVFSSPQQKDTYSHVQDCQITINPKIGFVRRFDSVHGLICLEGSKRLEIWNPTVKRFFTLPEHQGTGDGHYVGGFLGYEPIEGRYKVLCIVRGCNTQVLTLAARESWRVITKGSPMHWPAKDSGRCINGVIYYKAICLPYRHSLVSFDLRSESFGLIEFPMRDHVRFIMVSFEGRLALISSVGSVVEVWSLEDAEHQKYWSYKQFLFSLPADKSFECLDLKGVTDAGELIYTGMSLNGSFCVVYFDPKKDSIRETKFRGISGNEIWQPERLGFDLVNDFYVLPNHIESFIS